MYLQLHGDLPPLDYAENPYKGAAPLPVYSAGYPALGQSCAVNLPNDLLKKNAKSFKDSVKELEKTYDAIRQGKKKIKINDGTMAVDPATVGVVVQGGKWVIKNWEKIRNLFGAVQTLFFSLSAGGINNKTMNRYNANAFGVQMLCQMNARQILAKIDDIDAQINSVTTQLQSTPRLNVARRITLGIDLASLTQFRLAYQKQLDSMGGVGGVTAAGGGLGIAAAIGLALSLLR
jgi:hypothetical protein